MKLKEPIILLLIALIGSCLGIGGFLIISKQQSIPSIQRDSSKVKIPARIALSVVMGSDTRNTIVHQPTVIIFQDYQCGPCRALHQSIAEDKITKARFVFRNLPLRAHNNALFCATVAEAAREQGKQKIMSDFLFATGGMTNEQDVASFCKTAGIDFMKLKAAMQTTAKNRVEQDIRDAKTMGLNYTPTVILVKPGASPEIVSDISTVL